MAQLVDVDHLAATVRKRSLALRLGVLYLFRSMSLASGRKKHHPHRQTGRFRVGTGK
jgi:hypothetical protein